MHGPPCMGASYWVVGICTALQKIVVRSLVEVSINQRRNLLRKPWFSMSIRIWEPWAAPQQAYVGCVDLRPVRYLESWQLRV